MTNLSNHRWFAQVRRPSRYLGNEINAVVKDPETTELSVVLAFPDVYEVGMSHLGLKILYHILNRRPWVAAERAFAPWVDLEAEMERRGIPLCSLETSRPLKTFDLVGFSLQHELSYTNVLNMLHLGGIPLLAAERTPADPLVIAGGPACFNPEPVADFFDLMVVGDGESAVLEICRVLRDAKKGGSRTRDERLKAMRRIPGAYIPSYFQPRYGPDGTVRTVEARFPGHETVEKALVEDIDRFPYPEKPIVPYTELVHDRLAVEISRGCTRGCRFCQAGMIYRPVRERSLESVVGKVEEGLRGTGYDDISLLSLSSGDYSCIGPLLETLMDRQARDKVALSLPSLRIDSFDPSWIHQIKRVRKTGFTIAPEAGNDRLRRAINKDMSQERILETSRSIYEAGWQLIKLYFMVGLPFEQSSDLEDIVALAKDIERIAKKYGRRNRLNVSLATFVPKAHTPFMWMPQIDVAESRDRIQFVMDRLGGSRVRVKWNQPELSWLEGVFSRGDRRLGQVILEAWKRGARFDAWGEHFRLQGWKEGFGVAGLDPAFYGQRARSIDEVMPWDHIRCRVSKEFLVREFRRAQKGQPTPDCRKGCLSCGVCDHDRVDPVLFDGSRPALSTRRPEAAPAGAVKRYRLTFSKLDPARHLSHLEMMRAFMRALNRADITLRYSKGFHPLPKVSFGDALAVGMESQAEVLDLELEDPVHPADLMERLNQELPPGITVTAAREIPLRSKAPRPRETRFVITIDPTNCACLDEQAISRFTQSERVVLRRDTKKGTREINVRPLVKSLTLLGPNQIEVTLIHNSGPQVKPLEVIGRIFSVDESGGAGIHIRKSHQTLQ